MNETMKHTCKLTALSAALLAVFGNALAQDEEIKQLTQPESSVSIGAGWWNNERPEQGQYDGMRDSGGYPLLDMDIRNRDDKTGTWFILKGRNLGLDDRDIKAEWLRQGDIGGYMGFSQIPRVNPWTFNTGLVNINNVQTVSGTGANAFPTVPQTLETRRDLTTLGFFKNLKSLLPGLDFKIDFKNEEKSGDLQWGAYSGSASSQQVFLRNPLSSTTQQLDVKFTYAHEKLQLTGGYYGTWFTQHNPLTAAAINGQPTPGTSATNANPWYLAEPLSNQSYQVYLDGGYNFTNTTRGTFKLSYGSATQNETFPTWGQSAPLNPFVGTPSSLNGKLDTTLAEGALKMRPTPKLSVLAQLRYYDVSDKTPIVGVQGSNATGVATAWYTPNSFRTKSGKLEASYLLPANFTVIGDIDAKSQDRSVPPVGDLFVPYAQKLTEQNYSIQLRRNLSETINGSLAYVYSVRKGKDIVYPGDPNEDAINPMHIADRDRNKWRFVLDWAPLDRMSLQFVAEASNDSYGTTPNQPYGLLNGSGQLYSVDASYELGQGWQLLAWYSYDMSKATELGFRTAGGGAADAIKQSNLRETGNSFGVGLRGTPLAKLKVGADLEGYQTVNEYPQAVVPVGPGALQVTSGGVTVVPTPNIKNTLSRFKMFAEYAVQKNTDLRFDFIYERFHTDDWSWTMLPATGAAPWPYGSTYDGTTVTQPQNQPATFVGVKYIVKFF